MNTKQPITHIDATGLSCPVPLMLLKKAIDELPAGDRVQIEVTDVHAELDFEIWCERFGHQLEKTQESKGVMGFSVIKNTRTPVIE
jgi:TusA-related sulfurtransferase